MIPRQLTAGRGPFSEKLKDFERKDNRWFELSRQFILGSNQAIIIIASEENLEAKRDFLKKTGSQNEVLNDVLIINPRLASRALLLDFKNPWAILSEPPVASPCDAPYFGEKMNSETWLPDLDSNQNGDFQRGASYH